MKHFFSILFVVFVVAGAWWITKSEPLPKDRIVIFTQQSCSHCHEALAFINSKIKPRYPQIAIDIRDISEKKRLNQLRSLARQEKWDNVGTPVIVIGDAKIMGWSALKEMQLMTAVKKLIPDSQSVSIAPKKDTIPTETSADTPEGVCLPGTKEPCL